MEQEQVITQHKCPVPAVARQLLIGFAVLGLLTIFLIALDVVKGLQPGLPTALTGLSLAYLIGWAIDDLVRA